MQTFFWALGSTVVLMLITFFMPLGFTLKGKFSIVIIGFVLALVGLIASATFPLWQIILLLVVLVFFTAYIMDSRIGESLFKAEFSVSEELADEEETLTQYLGNNEMKNDNILGIDTLNIPNKEFMSNDKTIQKQLESENGKAPELVEEDISFFLGPDAYLENKDKTEENDLGYLSDIELMFNEEQKENLETSWLDELDELSSITIDQRKFSIETQENSNLSSSAILLGAKEAAATKAQDESDTIKKASM
jgi:hypothetical protein